MLATFNGKRWSTLVAESATPPARLRRVDPPRAAATATASATAFTADVHAIAYRLIETLAIA